jgi:hypothetical protein
MNILSLCTYSLTHSHAHSHSHPLHSLVGSYSIFQSDSSHFFITILVISVVVPLLLTHSITQSLTHSLTQSLHQNITARYVEVQFHSNLYSTHCTALTALHTHCTHCTTHLLHSLHSLTPSLPHSLTVLYRSTVAVTQDFTILSIK